jgi:hypothetical protein
MVLWYESDLILSRLFTGFKRSACCRLPAATASYKTGMVYRPFHLRHQNTKPQENRILVDQRRRHGYAQVLNGILEVLKQPPRNTSQSGPMHMPMLDPPIVTYMKFQDESLYHW